MRRAIGIPATEVPPKEGRLPRSGRTEDAPVAVVPHASSRLFFAVVASGIALGAAACSITVTDSPASNDPSQSPGPERLLATPVLGSVADAGAADASDASTDASDAAPELHDAAALGHPDGGDAGWEPTK